MLSYVPHAEDLEFAMSLAHGSSLAVVETVAFLAGWAGMLEAWKLVTEGPTPPLGPATKEAIERDVSSRARPVA